MPGFEATLPPDAEIGAMLPGGESVLYRACAAHMTGDAGLLDASVTTTEVVSPFAVKGCCPTNLGN